MPVFIGAFGLTLAPSTSNDKKKGDCNGKSGNKYLSWAYVEAANFAIRYSPELRAWYQRKASRTKRVVALKAQANKLSKACYFILRDGVDFDVKKLVGCVLPASVRAAHSLVFIRCSPTREVNDGRETATGGNRACAESV